MDDHLLELVTCRIHLRFKLRAARLSGLQARTKITVLRTGLFQQLNELIQFLIQQRKIAIHGAHYRTQQA